MPCAVTPALPPGRVRFQLCVITDGVGDGPRLLTRVEAALRGAPEGALAIQLRERTLPGAALYELAARLRTLTTKYAAALLINDRLDVALAVGADGVHLPAHGLPPAAARRIIPDAAFLVSVACHSLAEAQQAAAHGADLITLGPIWPTPSKPDIPLLPGQVRVQPTGVPALAQVAAALAIPVFALGGVDDVHRATECAQAGARIACIRAVLSAADPAAAVRSLLTAPFRSARSVVPL